MRPFYPPTGASALTPRCVYAVLAFCVLMGGALPAQAMGPAEVIEMVESGVSDKEIIEALSKAQKRFELSIQEVSDLRLRGVSDAVIGVMVNGISSALDYQRARAKNRPRAPFQMSRSERTLKHLTQRFKRGDSEEALRSMIAKTKGQFLIQTGAAKAAISAGLSHAFLKDLVRRNRSSPCNLDEQCLTGYHCSNAYCRAKVRRKKKASESVIVPESLDVLLLGHASVSLFAMEHQDPIVRGSIGLKTSVLLSDVLYIGGDLGFGFDADEYGEFRGVTNLGLLIGVGDDRTTYLDIHLDAGVMVAQDALFMFGGGVGFAVLMSELPAGALYIGVGAHGVMYKSALAFSLQPELGFGLAF